jgi:hypothetical protein
LSSSMADPNNALSIDEQLRLQREEIALLLWQQEHFHELMQQQQQQQPRTFQSQISSDLEPPTIATHINTQAMPIEPLMHHVGPPAIGEVQVPPYSPQQQPEQQQQQQPEQQQPPSEQSPVPVNDIQATIASIVSDTKPLMTESAIHSACELMQEIARVEQMTRRVSDILEDTCQLQSLDEEQLLFLSAAHSRYEAYYLSLLPLLIAHHEAENHNQQEILEQEQQQETEQVIQTSQQQHPERMSTQQQVPPPPQQQEQAPLQLEQSESRHQASQPERQCTSNTQHTVLCATAPPSAAADELSDFFLLESSDCVPPQPSSISTDATKRSMTQRSSSVTLDELDVDIFDSDAQSLPPRPDCTAPSACIPSTTATTPIATDGLITATSNDTTTTSDADIGLSAEQHNDGTPSRDFVMLDQLPPVGAMVSILSNSSIPSSQVYGGSTITSCSSAIRLQSLSPPPTTTTNTTAAAPIDEDDWILLSDANDAMPSRAPSVQDVRVALQSISTRILHGKCDVEGCDSAGNLRRCAMYVYKRPLPPALPPHRFLITCCIIQVRS